MPTTITSTITEQSTAVFTVALTDDAGAAVVPSAITWTLSDDDGNTINSRSEVAVGSPASSITVVLYGADLAIIGDDDDGARRLTIEATYDSDAGSDLTLKDAAKFTVTDLAAV